MKTLKKQLVLFCLAASAALVFAGCGGGSDPGDTKDKKETKSSQNDASEYSGIYIGGEYLLDLNFSTGEYVCQKDNGRVGRGECGYENDELFLVFDDFYYNIDTDNGSISLRQNGTGLYSENLDGLKLKKAPDASYNDYPFEALGGVRVSDEGTVLEINVDTRECSYSSEISVGGCNVNDDFNGKGPYLYGGTYKAYPILDADGGMVFEVQFQEDSDESDQEEVVFNGYFQLQSGSDAPDGFYNSENQDISAADDDNYFADYMRILDEVNAAYPDYVYYLADLDGDGNLELLVEAGEDRTLEVYRIVNDYGSYFTTYAGTVPGSENGVISCADNGVILYNAFYEGGRTVYYLGIDMDGNVSADEWYSSDEDYYDVEGTPLESYPVSYYDFQVF